MIKELCGKLFRLTLFYQLVIKNNEQWHALKTKSLYMPQSTEKQPVVTYLINMAELTLWLDFRNEFQIKAG